MRDLCVLCVQKFFLLVGLSVLYTNGEPVQIRTVEVIPSYQFTKVIVQFTSPKTTDIKWTIDEGFTPAALNPSTKVSFTRSQENATNVASIAIPKDLNFQGLRLHIVCIHSSFQVHAEFDISHASPASSEPIEQFTVFVPRETEIGTSSKGETRFHIYVNTTGSKFSFGLIEAEAHFVDASSAKVNSLVAYSFLPDTSFSALRIRPMFQTKNEYHADVLVKHPALHSTGGVISISGACTSTGSLIKRLDVKKTLYFHPRPGTSAVPTGSLALVDDMSSKVVTVATSDSTLLRCTAFGNPAPTIQLYRKNGAKLEKVNIPSYVISLPFKTSAVFQFVNVSGSVNGDYVCNSSNGYKDINTGYTVRVLK